MYSYLWNFVGKKEQCCMPNMYKSLVWRHHLKSYFFQLCMDKILSWRWLSSPVCFSAILEKRDNSCDFLLGFLEKETFLKSGPLIKERGCSWRSKLFPLRMGPIVKGSRNENIRVASPENIPILLKCCCNLMLLHCYIPRHTIRGMYLLLFCPFVHASRRSSTFT